MSAISSMARSGRKKNAEVRFAKHGGRSRCVRLRSLSAVRGRQRRLLCDCFGTICRPAGRTDALAADNCSKKFRPRGYTGSYSNLERVLTKWRRAKRAAIANSCFDARSRDNNCDRSCNSCCDASRYISSNRLADFADCRCGALHEAARIANDGSSGKGRSFEERFIGICHDALACHAISRHSSEQKR